MQAVLARSGGGTTRAFVERFAEVDLGGAESGSDAKHKAGDHGYQNREDEHGAIESDRKNLRNSAGGDFQKRPERGPSKQQAEETAGEGEQDAFRQ